jgi:protein arginine kinase activator
MKCDYCEKKATVFLTQLTDGQMKKVCLCEGCAEERGVTDPTGFSLADMLMGDFQKSAGDSAPTSATPKKESFSSSPRVCSECGFSIEDFQKVRRFGCANCYKTFAAELTPLLRGMHKGFTHVGKVPEGLMESHVRRQRMEELNLKLEGAIASESYEEAAKLRDELKKLEEMEVGK